ncbi:MULTISPECIES: serine/threonine-protein kinase [unclassified Actinopolyspora]|uniref:serine/threonine-protein kinase n=1 Tax=unclassified Actinopolyspora TaxID=2639451 RepID=UPI0013F5B65E|nr:MULTISPECIES: serine/threonine-protein kinase [unclassified Actinopolyspora]NHD16019.1 protein kinase [Actinopolyspora sp. BKK2]NHE74767.1 protein kinase [Actinopolyspora sp. BKK1]
MTAGGRGDTDDQLSVGAQWDTVVPLDSGGHPAEPRAAVAISAAEPVRNARSVPPGRARRSGDRGGATVEGDEEEPVGSNRVIARRYELTSPIGRGSMGDVWSGYDQRLDRRIAVKLLPATKLAEADDPQNLTKRFVREAQLTAKVEHPGVPAVHDVGTEGDELFLVMQRISGTDLVNVIGEHAPLSVTWSASIAAQIAAVLSSAHEASLIHRDLKPSNVMIADSGTVKVLDFGIAAVLEGGYTKLTRAGESMGTPAYMAPEQAMNNTATPAGDLYSLGCVLHELLSGERVFEAPGAPGIVHKHMSVSPTPLRECGAAVPADLERLVLDLLAKNPQDRPEDAGEVYRRLLPYLPAPEDSATAVDGGDPTAPYRHPHAPRSARRRPESTEPSGEVPAADPHEAEERIRSEQQRANELVDEARFTQAAELLRSLLVDRSLRQQLTPDRRTKIRRNLATFHFLGGDYRAALEEYSVLLAELDDYSGASTASVLECRVMAATCRMELGENQRAARELRSLLNEYLRLLPEELERILEVRVQLATLLSNTGETDEARQLLRQVLAVATTEESALHAEQAQRMLDRLDELGR